MPFVVPRVRDEVGPHRYSANSLWAKHSVQMHYAYILQSISHPEKFYYGSTADLKKRLAVHNDGGNVSTSPYRPWALAWYGGFPCKQTAANFERYLKTASGKAFARKRLL